MSAADRWQERVEAHHAQSLKAQELIEPIEDFWRPYAARFRADPHRTDDPVLNRLLREAASGKTVLDVGGGGGRLALPLALHCDSFTVVEPSASMLDELRRGADDTGIGNVTIVEGPWEEVSVDPAEIVLVAHVLYGVADVVPFVRKLEEHARERVLILTFMRAPQSYLSPLWKAVHNEERVDLPALPELLEVLWEMDIYPDLEMVQASGPAVFESRDEALEELRSRLYVSPGAESERRLKRAVDQELVEVPDGLQVRGSPGQRQGLLSWSTLRR